MYIMVKTENIISDFFVKFSLAFLIQNDNLKIIDDLEKNCFVKFFFVNTNPYCGILKIIPALQLLYYFNTKLSKISISLLKLDHKGKLLLSDNLSDKYNKKEYKIRFKFFYYKKNR